MISRRLLDDDETVVVSTRTHVKALLRPALLLILVAAAAGVLSSLPGGEARDVIVLVVWLVAFGAIAVLVGRPVLEWLTSTYTLTDRRLITRTGVLSRRGHDILLSRVSDVTYERGVADRLLGCGTLVVASGGHGQVRLHDIPHVEQVSLRVSELLHGGSERARTDGGA